METSKIGSHIPRGNRFNPLLLVGSHSRCRKLVGRPRLSRQSQHVSAPTCYLSSLKPKVAEKLVIMHEECLEGNYQSVEKLRTTNPPPVAHVKPLTDEDDDDDDDDDEDDCMDADNATTMTADVPDSRTSLNPAGLSIDEPKPSQAAEAEDGWLVVSSRRNKGGRN
ncbi:uncharacterized protein LOC120153782 [Hibiscus syriacus]|uniref:uncharacterized protein LOC120153782 n=1 Tax=Hibiscus syriacus TaxID=106335 RepID=UPI001923A66E|nr:uncharacterized protein LOC120153782 [Hibiscus syriacus]